MSGAENNNEVLEGELLEICNYESRFNSDNSIPRL